MSTPTSARPRTSGIPTPGRSSTPSAIPTPGRARSTSVSAQSEPLAHHDEYASRAYRDAIKANDPAQHRSSRSSNVSPSLATFPPQSGRTSVTGRPDSSSSSSSALSSGPSRTSASQPQSARPPSRQSDVFGPISSRAARVFEVGDNVRIESLGFEGTLRYLGEIDGKPGIFAGVELNGGFAGKGKNNGAVGGKQYFTCPPNCGVFIASAKLSAPTVGYGSISRPSSVASSRSGRVTPSFSGRVTPSTSTVVPGGRKTPSLTLTTGRVTPSYNNGRVTPSSTAGRKTPGIVPPRIHTTSPYTTAHPKTPTRSAPPQGSITPGSRASRYVGMTAKQLSSRGAGVTSPSQTISADSPIRSIGFPSSGPGHLSSPTKDLSSPYHTPKARGRTSNIGIGVPGTTPTKGRAGPNTPRARVPSAIAMPPPASPHVSSQSISLNDPPFKERGNGSVSDLEQNGKALQDRIAGLVRRTPDTASRPPDTLPRPESSSSVASSAAIEYQHQLDRMQAQLGSLEQQNQRLRTATTVHEREAQEASERIQKLLSDHSQDSARIAELEVQVRTNERLLGERDSAMEALERAAQQTALDIDKIKSDGEARLRDVQSKLDDQEELVTHLKELIEAKEGLASENDAVLKAKDAEITLLQARVQKAYVELEEERKELGGQVDELRKAGQETIALYEERLSVADSRRYDLEDEISALQEQLRKLDVPPSPTMLAHHVSSAAEIDNEALRDQVQHLQKKILALEDKLEDAQVAFEREETAVHERMKRYKEREDELKHELQETRDEVTRVVKSEEGARLRVEEIEEALRENTVALENARAEIEGLRNDIAILEAANVNGESAGSSERLAEVAQRTANERGRLMDEIVQLRQRLASQADEPSGSAEDTVRQLTETAKTLQTEKAKLQQLYDEREAELAHERDAAEELRLLFDERGAEVEAVRKKLNRDMPVNGLDAVKALASPTKHDVSAARDEITGLKHIVQELQKELSAEKQRNKVQGSENSLLLSETGQLREKLKVLEETVEQTILREEQALVSGEESPMLSASGDAAALEKSLKELKAKHKAEFEQLRQKHTEAELKNARTTHELNKEISELETLIESKIYREDELEREVERLKEKLARRDRKSSKTGLHEEPARHGGPPRGAEETAAAAPGVCELCDQPGHEAFECTLLGKEQLVCEDCEGVGHTAANCPSALDVF